MNAFYSDELHYNCIICSGPCFFSMTVVDYIFSDLNAVASL